MLLINSYINTVLTYVYTYIYLEYLSDTYLLFLLPHTHTHTHILHAPMQLFFDVLPQLFCRSSPPHPE